MPQEAAGIISQRFACKHVGGLLPVSCVFSSTFIGRKTKKARWSHGVGSLAYTVATKELSLVQGARFQTSVTIVNHSPGPSRHRRLFIHRETGGDFDGPSRG